MQKSFLDDLNSQIEHLESKLRRIYELTISIEISKNLKPDDINDAYHLNEKIKDSSAYMSEKDRTIMWEIRKCYSSYFKEDSDLEEKMLYIPIEKKCHKYDYYHMALRVVNHQLNLKQELKEIYSAFHSEEELRNIIKGLYYQRINLMVKNSDLVSMEYGPKSEDTSEITI